MDIACRRSDVLYADTPNDRQSNSSDERQARDDDPTKRASKNSITFPLEEANLRPGMEGTPLILTSEDVRRMNVEPHSGTVIRIRRTHGRNNGRALTEDDHICEGVDRC